MDALFKPGNYRTSNHGDMWHHVIENMPDGSGRVVARCEKEEDAERIVREHNAHEGLVELVHEHRSNVWLEKENYACSCLFEPPAVHHKVTLQRYNDQLASIDAVLAQAEGRGDGPG